MSGAVIDRLASHPRLRAWLPVAVLPPIFLAEALLTDKGPDVTAFGPIAAIVGCLPLVLRSRIGFWVLAPLMTAGIVLILWQLEPGNTVVLIPMVALTELGARSDRRHNVGFGLAIVPCVIVSVLPFADDAGEMLSVVVRNVALRLLALAVGDMARSRRDAIEEEAERRMGEERLRIAREVHDVVAHAMVAINVQAGVAAHRARPRSRAGARRAAARSRTSAATALTDLRATLGVLRERDDGRRRSRPTAGPRRPRGARGRLRAAGVRRRRRGRRAATAARRGATRRHTGSCRRR